MPDRDKTETDQGDCARSVQGDEERSVGISGAEHPKYVKDALRGLTRTQCQYVLAGCLHGDVTMATVRALKNKALFYLKVTSPNGRCGHMVLTPLGETVRGILQSRRHNARDGASPKVPISKSEGHQ